MEHRVVALQIISQLSVLSIGSMWRINRRVNKLGQSLWRFVYSPNWSISLCGCQDTWGSVPWCSEHVQTPAEIQTQTCASAKTLCMYFATVNLRHTASVERVCVCACLQNIIFDKYVVRGCVYTLFSEVFFMWLHNWLREAKLPGCIQSAVGHVLHPVWLSGGCLYLCLITPVPLSTARSSGSAE